tara:strand:- start:2 stop:1057 length:1056 start_codon:yes stop_codon:yes gene_type:complete
MSSYIDKKFINILSGTLDKFSWKRENLANCRCPICGDSQKHKTKTRLYFYQKENAFLIKCHNCSYSSNLYNFIKEVSPSLIKEYAVETWKEKNVSKTNKSDKIRENEMISLLKKNKFKPKQKLLKDLTRVCDLDKDHVGYKFISMRKIPKKFYDILYYTSDFGSWMRKVDPDCAPVGKEERLIIPFFNKNGDLVAAQGRALNFKDEAKARTTARYITVKADKSIDRLWYGMWRADPKKKVYVVEGPLDSLFLDNCIAMVGAGAIENVHPRFENSEIVYALDNEPRNKQICNYISRLIEKGCSVCIWPDKIKEKDINDMIYNRKPSKIKKIIDENTFSGLEATLRFRQWKKV